MGVNTHLFVSNDWSADDVISVIKQLAHKNEVKITPTHTPDYFVAEFQYAGLETAGLENRSMSIFRNSERFGFRGTLLDVNYWGSSVEIMATIAKKLGGILVPSDSSDEAKVFDGTIQGTNDMMFWAKQAALEGKNFNKAEDLGKFISEYKKKHGWKSETAISLPFGGGQ